MPRRVGAAGNKVHRWSPCRFQMAGDKLLGSSADHKGRLPQLITSRAAQCQIFDCMNWSKCHVLSRITVL